MVAQVAVERLSLDRLLFLVAGLPPHKLGELLSPPHTRVEMARAAVAENPLLDVSEVELDREGPTYTVDTLRLVRAEHPDAEFFFLLGSDQLAEFHEWQEPEGIAGLATLVAVSRDGLDPDQMSPIGIGSGRELEFMSMDVTRVDISSSQIRARVRDGLSIRYLVPEAVRRIIETHRLYRSIS
jgi:nicotinate-nucleotide adenylyltransferase